MPPTGLSTQSWSRLVNLARNSQSMLTRQRWPNWQTSTSAALCRAALASLTILRGEPRARLIVFSSIAAVRPRIGNIVYGSAKSGLDAFARELAAPAKQVGVQVVVVRPGFVHSRMTEGLEAAPFATTPDQVANDMVAGLKKGRAIIHSPAVLAPVGLVLKNLPGVIWRHISTR